MMTFTFRISTDVAQRLSSSEMRSWITEFLGRPQALPPDPGPGEARISLTLPGESVRDLARLLGCSPSAALRRLAVEHLGDSAQTTGAKPTASQASSKATNLRIATAASKTSVQRAPGLPSRAMPPQGNSSALCSRESRYDSMTNEDSGWLLALVLAPVVALVVWLFFNFGRGNPPE